jgi:hypothetical protein
MAALGKSIPAHGRNRSPPQLSGFTRCADKSGGFVAPTLGHHWHTVPIEEGARDGDTAKKARIRLRSRQCKGRRDVYRACAHPVTRRLPIRLGSVAGSDLRGQESQQQMQQHRNDHDIIYGTHERKREIDRIERIEAQEHQRRHKP